MYFYTITRKLTTMTKLTTITTTAGATTKKFTWHLSQQGPVAHWAVLFNLQVFGEQHLSAPDALHS